MWRRVFIYRETGRVLYIYIYIQVSIEREKGWYRDIQIFLYLFRDSRSLWRSSFIRRPRSWRALRRPRSLREITSSLARSRRHLCQVAERRSAEAAPALDKSGGCRRGWCPCGQEAKPAHPEEAQQLWFERLRFRLAFCRRLWWCQVLSSCNTLVAYRESPVRSRAAELDGRIPPVEEPFPPEFSSYMITGMGIYIHM